MELMSLNGTRHVINILLATILLMTFPGRLLYTFPLSVITLPLYLISWNCFIVIICNVQAECKISLQKELGLPMRPDCPMVSLLSAMQNSCSLFLVLTVAETYRLDSLEDWTTRKVLTWFAWQCQSSWKLMFSL